MEGIRTERRGETLEVTLDRPKANAIDSATSRALSEAFVGFRDDPELRVAILTGAGERFFSAGWDLKAAAAGDPEDFGAGGFGGLTELFDLDKPVIAAVNGWAAGGGFEIALACDMVLAVPEARFALPEVRRGFVADAGGVLRLPRRMPRPLAMEMMLTGEPIDAATAERWGLVNRLVERQGLMAAARELAERVIAAAPLAVRAVKGIVAATEELPIERAYEVLKGTSVPAMAAVHDSEDAREGPRAFAEGRDPVWRGPVSASLAPEANAGKVVLVSGGGTGIGRAIARSFAATGARLAICGRRVEKLEALRDELEADGVECLSVPCDVREQEQVVALVDAVLERYGRIDVLVNNAGGQFEAPAEEIVPKGWRAVHRLSVDAVWALTNEVATRSMIPGDGGLITFTGFSPRRGIPGFAHATAARAALENLAQGLALEWSRYRIRTVCVVPGSIDTEALANYGAEAYEASRRQVPLGRLGRPEEVGDVVAFLATEGGGFITGCSVLVDGGLDAWGQAVPPPQPE